MIQLLPLAALLLALGANSPAADNRLPVADGERQWPQAGGPHGTWAVESDSVPLKWTGFGRDVGTGRSNGRREVEFCGRAM